MDLCQFQVGTKDEAEVTSVAATAQETGKFNLPALYDQLTAFVTEHSNYKLRFVEGDDDEEDEEQASISFTVPFIQLHLLEVEAELFISRNQLSIKHASLSTPQQSESFLRDLMADDEDVSLESAEEIESFLQVIEEGVKQRLQLMSMIDALMIPEGISLAFSPLEANSIVMQSTTSTVTAKIDWTSGSVIWSSSTGDTAVLEEVNAIALKYRSVSDCLASQLEVLFSSLK